MADPMLRSAATLVNYMNVASGKKGRPSAIDRVQAMTIGPSESAASLNRRYFDLHWHGSMYDRVPTSSPGGAHGYVYAELTDPGAAGYHQGFSHVSAIPLGTGINCRDKDQIVVTSFSLKSYIQRVEIDSCVRLMMVYDAHPNKVAPTLADIIYCDCYWPAPGSYGTAEVNVDSGHRFQLLADELVVSSTEHPLQLVDWHFQGRWPMRFSGDTGTIASVVEGAFYFVSVMAFVTQDYTKAPYLTELTMRFVYNT